jgi:hypothetical protein
MICRFILFASRFELARDFGPKSDRTFNSNFDEWISETL